MKYLIYLFAIIILLAVNIGLFNNLQIKGQIPNLLFLMTLFFVLEKKSYDFFFISMVSGLFLDFFSTSFFGSFTVALLTLSLLLHFFVGKL
jgi:cell shape-determining protein MreD